MLRRDRHQAFNTDAHGSRVSTTSVPYVPGQSLQSSPGSAAAGRETAPRRAATASRGCAPQKTRWLPPRQNATAATRALAPFEGRCCRRPRRRQHQNLRRAGRFVRRCRGSCCWRRSQRLRGNLGHLRCRQHQRRRRGRRPPRNHRSLRYLGCRGLPLHRAPRRHRCLGRLWRLRQKCHTSTAEQKGRRRRRHQCRPQRVRMKIPAGGKTARCGFSRQR